MNDASDDTDKLNQTNSELEKNSYDFNDPVPVPLAVFTYFVAALGIIANLLLIVALLKNKKKLLSQRLNVFIFSMAVSGL